MANFKRLSRYNNRTLETNRSGQRFITLRPPLDIQPGTGDVYITITQELLQRPDLISYRAYGNREYWWLIYEFNGINDPFFELQLNQTLRIPSLDRVRDALESTR